jgi:hypothetical protein
VPGGAVRIGAAQSGSLSSPGAAVPGIVREVLGDSGRPLDPGVRQRLEPRFGHDFSNVRIHADDGAALAATAVQARAFTAGAHIVFGSGEYAPAGQRGRSLLAHELVHVVQQSAETPHRQMQSQTFAALDSPLKAGAKAGLDDENRPFAGSAIPKPARRAEHVSGEPAGSERVAKVQSGRERRRGGLNAAVFPGVKRPAGNRTAGTPVRSPLASSAVIQRAPSEQPADSPVEVLEAIVHMLSWETGLAQDVGPRGEPISTPGYYIDTKKSIHEAGHVGLLWAWYRIAVGEEPDGHGGWRSIEGSGARARISKVDAETRTLLASVSRGGRSGGGWAAAYTKGVAHLTARAAREEVSTAIDAGLARERLSHGHAEKVGSEDEETESLLRHMLDLNLELVEASHKVSEHYGETIHEAAAKARAMYDKRVGEYLARVFKEHDIFADAPEPQEFEHASSSFATGMAFVKGGLDAALAIMAVADPKKREELFAHHSRFFGKVGGAAKIGKVLLQFASAGVAYYGYTTYSVAKVAGNTKLAESVLDLTVHRIGSVSNVLSLVGAIHGVAVLLDPEAPSEQKGEAAVETLTNAVALAGTAGRSIPILEGVAGWSGPFAAALSINWVALKRAAAAYEQAKEGIASLGGSKYFDEAMNAATEVQDWMARLAVIHALLAVETDEPRKKRLLENEDGCSWAILNQQLKPYFERLFGAAGKQDDEGRVGLRAMLRPVVPLVDSGKAFDAGLAFLQVVGAAFERWGRVVLAKEDPTQPKQFVGRHAVVITNVWTGNAMPPGVIHVRNDADKAAGRSPSVAPDEPYFRARSFGAQGWNLDHFLPGQVVRIWDVVNGEAWVSLDNLTTPVLEVGAVERIAAGRV